MTSGSGDDVVEGGEGDDGGGVEVEGGGFGLDGGELVGTNDVDEARQGLEGVLRRA